MRQLSSIVLLGAAAVFMGGCDALSFLPGVGGDDGVEVVESIPDEDATAQAPQEAFSEPTAEGASVPAAPAEGLIPATDPQARIQEIKQSRPDPFSAIPTTPLNAAPPDLDTTNGQGGAGANGEGNKPSEPGQAIQEVPPLPIIPQPPRIVDASPLPRPRNSSAGGNGMSGGSSGNGGNGGNGATGNSIATGPSFIPDLPDLPQPTLAEGVNVTGVIQVNGVPHAIVEAPGQQSRYVKAGDYLANGQVLVKRIEVNRGRTPVVILEQSGIEVAKRVGEGGAMAGSESASVPSGDRPRG
ncbi:MAG: hypothetical protein SAJ12_11945 [Jaaginema sp. PMC 1079.18]|nr:hypothetical protein [Jaaginema sp. PMC 1080.18]MEC4851718.1 hypothetical protein [Jaaginema sp. PMC 1079.18]MEC4868457.1 hypothetical protein [Jaaginema sp. PMC 1078.18]